MNRSRPAVLFVHDDGHGRVQAARWLAGAKFRCYVAEDAGSANRLADLIDPEIVVIAASVSGSSGFAGQYDDRPHTTAVVVIDNVRRSRKASGAAGGESPANYITIAAPVSAEDLLHAVRCALTWRAEVAVLEEHARKTLVETVRTRQRALQQVVMSSSTPASAHEQLERMFEAPPPVFSHARRVAGLARVMAQSLNLSGESCADIEGAALLHDIGKLALPEAVLSGEAPIGDPEMEVLLGSHARTLQLLDGTPTLASVSWLIRQSREWWDGSGGPEGTRGWDIPIGARILAVADAIATEQDCAGRMARPSSFVNATIGRRAGTRFDPDVVRAGLRAIDSRSCC
jgi:response regulator RpfG family c-di-GMP phosphodiesterase